MKRKNTLKDIALKFQSGIISTVRIPNDFLSKTKKTSEMSEILLTILEPIYLKKVKNIKSQLRTKTGENYNLIDIIDSLDFLEKKGYILSDTKIIKDDFDLREFESRFRGIFPNNKLDSNSLMSNGFAVSPIEYFNIYFNNSYRLNPGRPKFLKSNSKKNLGNLIEILLPSN